MDGGELFRRRALAPEKAMDLPTLWGWYGAVLPFPFTGECSGISIPGMTYPLHPHFLDFHSSPTPPPVLIFPGEPAGPGGGLILLHLFFVALHSPPRPLRASVSPAEPRRTPNRPPAASSRRAHAGAVLAWLWRRPARPKLLGLLLKGRKLFPSRGARVSGPAPRRLLPPARVRCRTAGRGGEAPQPPTSLSRFSLFNQNTAKLASAPSATSTED